MQPYDWQSEQPTLVRILRERLGDKSTCIEVINSYDEIMQAVWDFMSRLLADAGTRAVFARSLQISAQGAPILQNVTVNGRGFDFGNLRTRVVEPDCNMAEVMDALFRLAAMIFETLSDLTGNSITEPLLNHIEKANGEAA